MVADESANHVAGRRFAIGWADSLAKMTRPHPDPNQLLAAVAEGDRAAFAQLFEHFAPRIATYLIRGGTSLATAEEVAQEAMIVVWRKAHTFDASRGAASTWIFTIARNQRIDRFRQSAEDDLALAPELDDLVDDAESPEDRVSGFELRQRMQTALDCLSPDHARLVRMCYFSERPHAEIARDLSVPLGTVKSRMRVALGHLRRLLDTDRP